MGWEQCLMYDKIGHRLPQENFVVNGLYGSVIKSEKSFFTNDPLSHPDSTGHAVRTSADNVISRSAPHLRRKNNGNDCGRRP